MLKTIKAPCNLKDLDGWLLEECQEIASIHEKHLLFELGKYIESYVCWAKSSLLLWEGCDRVQKEKGKQLYHQYPEKIKNEAKAEGVELDSRSNGPAVVAYLIAGGERPWRYDLKRGWSIHHIYNGRHPYIGCEKTLHAVKDGQHFTQSAGLVAIHPIADAVYDEYPFMAWRLRAEAYLRFGYDPDGVF